MPSKDYPRYLADIAESIAHIQEFVGIADLAEVQRDRKTQAAVERELQILTEAATRLGEEANSLCPGPDWRNVRGLGNILRHAYDHIDFGELWVIVKQDLPALQTAVQDALHRLKGEAAE